MRKLLTAITMFYCLATTAQEQDLAFLHLLKYESDSSYHLTASLARPSAIVSTRFANFDLRDVMAAAKPVKRVLGYSKKGKPVDAYYFPGTSTKKALVIGGVHGSELSSVEIAKQLLAQLGKGEKPYYSVVIVPSLFPDNAATAEACKFDRVAHNVGRYTEPDAIDPNRQLPSLGQPFLLDNAVDAYGRKIEAENQLLLQLIQAWEPDRIVNLHAIKDYGKSGIYADPRTDCRGRALGYASDSALAVTMAKYIDEKGGKVYGNKVKTAPTALYYLDPKPAALGEMQQRNLVGANMKGKINGVSLGSWASTAVCDEENNYYRKAARILTVEFPGYKKPTEYKQPDDRKWYKELVGFYATSIYTYFLGEFFVEEEAPNERSLVFR